MELLRLATFGATALLCTGGYLASVFAYFQGSTARYTAAVESSSVPFLALGLLIITMVLAFIPRSAESEEESP